MAVPFQWSSIVFGLSAILGLMLLITALFPRRRGKTPYCRRCRYNLTGIESKRCPECGTPLSVRGAVLHGERRRRPRLAILGLVVLLGGTGPLGVRTYRWAKSVRWYSYRPIAWVTGDFLTSAGLRFGLQLGVLVWGAAALGLLSITTARPTLLLGWFLGQSIELGIAGAVAGAALTAARLRGVVFAVAGLILLSVTITVILQASGLAPALRA